MIDIIIISRLFVGLFSFYFNIFISFFCPVKSFVDGFKGTQNDKNLIAKTVYLSNIKLIGMVYKI